jgi:hypothetical protein
VLDASGNTTISGAATISGNAVVTGTLQANGVTGTIYPLVQGTAVASTSGTSIDFTGIPSWVRRVTVMFNGVSTNGTNNLQIQIGSSSGFVTSGYAGAGGTIVQAGTSAVANTSAGFLVEAGATISVAATVRHGRATILNISGNIWVFDSTISNSTSTQIAFGAGGVTLSGVLDRVRITTVGGTDTFDAGSINLLWE